MLKWRRVTGSGFETFHEDMVRCRLRFVRLGRLRYKSSFQAWTQGDVSKCETSVRISFDLQKKELSSRSRDLDPRIGCQHQQFSARRGSCCHLLPLVPSLSLVSNIKNALLFVEELLDPQSPMFSSHAAATVAKRTLLRSGMSCQSLRWFEHGYGRMPYASSRILVRSACKARRLAGVHAWTDGK